MVSTQATLISSFTSGTLGTREHCETIEVQTASTVASGTVNPIHVWQPWEHDKTRDVLALHPVAIWKRLQLNVVPGPGIFGRAVTLHFAWGSSNVAAPTTLRQLRNMHGYKTHVFGGAGDPGEADKTIQAPFGDSRTDILKAQSLLMGGRTILYYFFTEANFGTTQVAGVRFFFLIDGEFEVFGRN